MPYALIPDGYSLKKVTKAQMKAVDDKRRHDDVIAILENDAAVKVGGAAIGALALGGLAAVFIPLLEKKVGALSDDFKDAIGEVFDFLNPIPEAKEFLDSVNPFHDPNRVNPWLDEIKDAQDYMDAQKQRREQGLTPYSSYEEWRSERIRGMGF